MADIHPCQLASLPPELFEDVLLRLDATALLHLVKTSKGFLETVRPFLWKDASFELAKMRPIDAKLIHGQFLRNYTMTLKLRFDLSARSKRLVATNFRQLCHYGIRMSKLHILTFCDKSALDLASWKFLKTVLTSESSTLSTTLRTIQFPRTSPKRDIVNPLEEFLPIEIYQDGRPRRTTNCSAAFEIQTPVSEHRPDGVLTIKINGRTNRLGDVYREAAWGTYTPVVKDFVLKVARLCEDDKPRLSSASISHDNADTYTDVGYLMSDVGVGSIDKPASVPKISYDTINFKHCPYGRLRNKWEDLDMLSIKDVTLTDCQNVHKFFEGCMGADDPPQVQRLIFRSLDDEDMIHVKDHTYLTEFVRDSTEIEELSIATATYWELNPVRMLHDKSHLTVLEFSDGNKDVHIDLLSEIVVLCPAVREFGMRCSAIQRVLEKGKINEAFRQKVAAIAKQLVKLVRLETVTFVYRTLGQEPNFRHAHEVVIGDERYKIVANEIYRQLVEAAKKADQPCIIKTIQLKRQLYQEDRGPVSLTIKLPEAVIHVFEY
ncbi:uncharacterized protein J4E79_004107 [Alternaria viburni]|uniref:uncharacterized protein n=1 Tax=Alternaria viburni TaxID=566460 RepID=UPI0020C261A9|nr:uncharacterized protein J4E79_004107 [Alternaria viburni]KAI4662798.1 hypothetical protein J4E79_004107 [Alternaria viburni]